MGLGQGRQDVGHGGRIQIRAGVGHKPVAQTDQVVAHIDGRRHVVRVMHRRSPVTIGVVVFDVVVDQRRLVEDFDGGPRRGK